MIWNYLKTAFRNLLRNKLYSAITIGGLALGLTACILILFYVSHENSYDKFHADAGRIYSIEGKILMGSDTIYMSALNPVVAKEIENASPAVVSSLRLFNEYKPLIVKNPKDSQTAFSEQNFSYADANFFDFFSFKLLKGEKKSVLSKPYSLVISQDLAKKYFGNNNPIGETLQVKKDSIYLFTVTGVMQNAPSNSSITVDILASLNSLKTMTETKDDFHSDIFRGGSFPTYIKLKNTTDVSQVEKTMQELSLQSDPDSKDTYQLNSLTDKHLKSRTSSNSKYIKTFPLIAVLILLLALVNYLSLSTARATLRAKEIGVRKVNGASRKSVALQFYVESTLYVILSFGLAIALSRLLRPWFFELLGINIDASFFFNTSFLILLGGLLVFTVLATGLYPAVIMSSFNPIDNLKSSTNSKTGGIALRKICTTVQFVIAVALMVSGMVIYQQLNHMRNIDTGLNRSDLLMLPLQKTIGSNSTPFRDEIESLPQVNLTAVAQYPMYRGYTIYSASANDTQEELSLPVFSVDEDFFNTLGVKWKNKPLEEHLIAQKNKVVINEATITKFHLKPNPIGETISFGNTPHEIVGVVQNFNFETLNAPIDALTLFVSPKTIGTTQLMGEWGGCLYVRFQPNADLKKMVTKIEGIYAKYDEASPFEYEFMDDAFDAMFRSEERLSHIFNIFIILTFLIAGMGLFGLATFTAQQRVKEIGIRKVLGASVMQLTSLLSLDFLKLVFLAILIASPLAWYFMQQWLEDFTYRTAIHWWVFALAGIGTLLLAIITVSFQAIKAAIANPVKSLRTE